MDGEALTVDDFRESDRARRRKSDVQGKLYNFLNRSAQSLTRSNSQSGKSRRATKDKTGPGDDDDDGTRDSPRASREASSRLPGLGSGNAPETSPLPQSRLTSSARTSRSAVSSGSAIAATGAVGELLPPPRKSSSPPLTPPGSQHKHTLSIPARSKTPVSAYSYNTPPQTPARSRKYSNPSSPGGRDLLLNRPLARPITPSNSSSGKKLFGIPLPSPTYRKAALLEVEEEVPKQQRHSGHKIRSGSESSNEPLLHDRSASNDSSRTGNTIPRPSTGTIPSRTITPRPSNIKTAKDKSATPTATPSSSLPRSARSAVSSREEQPSSRRGTPRLDFWRSLTPRAPSSQGDREKEKEKGKQRATTPDPSTAEKQDLVSPQPRPPGASFLPRFQRTPATPRRRGEETDPESGRATNTNTVRLDSFMSDSLPIPQDAVKMSLALAQNGAAGPGLTTRQPAFANQNDIPRSPRTPGPERPKTAPALGPGIQRSNSTPGGSRGRLSPCLRIPSPKFLSRDRSRSKEQVQDKEKEREKERERGMYSEKGARKVTPESVGAPILREPRTYTHAHPHVYAHGVPTGGIAGVNGEKGAAVGALKVPKASLVQLRRAAHGTFDFERPGSRTSSKSGQSESRGTRSDEEGDRDKENQNERENEGEPYVRKRVLAGLGRPGSTRPPDLTLRTKGKAPSPIPPLPTPSSRVKQHSPPPAFPRTRSPLSSSAHQHSQSHSHSHSHAHVDDSALPRLSSSSARRNSASNTHFRTPGYSLGAGVGGVYRPPPTLPQFSFEPAARVPSPPSVPPKPMREAGGQYIDTRTGLIMYASASPEPRSPKSPKGAATRLADERARKGGGASAEGAGTGTGRRTPANTSAIPNGHAANGIPQKDLEEATAVISQFKSALDEAGFATLQKYVRRYDAKIIPLDGAAGLLARVQRLLDTSAPRVDERRKRQLYESFVRVVRVNQVS